MSVGTVVAVAFLRLFGTEVIENGQLKLALKTSLEACEGLCHAFRCLPPRQGKESCKPLRWSLYGEQKEQHGGQNENGGGSGGRGQRRASRRVT